MKQLIIGLGEVGKALQKILECDGIDSKDTNSEKYDVLHICFPYSDSFVEAVRKYKDFYNAELVIVHSTVPVGTCDPEGWTHSPVRGVHPNLEQGIRTFPKYFGGMRAREAAKFFQEKGIMCSLVQKAASTEAAKLWDTTQYGLMILIEKEIHEYCEKHDLDFDVVYTDFNTTYNYSYTKLGMPHVVRPHLLHKEGPIGGHCVIQNAKLLDSPAAEHLLSANSDL